MKLSFQSAGSAGDLTLLVNTPVPPEELRPIAQRLLSIDQLQASRVCFLTKPIGSGVIRLNFPGNVFSSNAMALGALAFAVEQGIYREKKLLIEAAGLTDPCTVHVNPLAGQAAVDLPLPTAVEKISILGQEVPMIVFPGILHLLWKGSDAPPTASLLPALQTLCQEKNSPAAGCMLWDFRAKSMHPLVYRAEEENLISRSTCSSGAAAAAAWTALHNREHQRRLEVHQPGGTIQTTAICPSGKLRRLTAAFPVALGPTYEITF